eukprot:5055270-Amphidinium_carterae.1
MKGSLWKLAPGNSSKKELLVLRNDAKIPKLTAKGCVESTGEQPPPVEEEKESSREEVVEMPRMENETQETLKSPKWRMRRRRPRPHEARGHEHVQQRGDKRS